MNTKLVSTDTADRIKFKKLVERLMTNVDALAAAAIWSDFEEQAKTYKPADVYPGDADMLDRLKDASVLIEALIEWIQGAQTA